jgi:hypothetical protein
MEINVPFAYSHLWIDALQNTLIAKYAIFPRSMSGVVSREYAKAFGARESGRMPFRILKSGNVPSRWVTSGRT